MRPTLFQTIASVTVSRRGDTTADFPLTPAIVNDSRQVAPGGVFIAIPGWNFDGHDYIDEALARGAAAILHERPLDAYRPDVAYFQCSSTALAQGLIWRAFYEAPDDDIEVLGVTGTNGKTTTAFLLEHIFTHAGRPCGLISTVEYRDGKTRCESTNTTPGARRIYGLLAAMRDNGLRAAAMELSSHALDQKRAAGLRLAAGIFTNLTGDHLDYHGDMEHYYLAKRKMFTELLRPDGCAVVNVDDAYGARLARELAGRCRVETFGACGAAKWRITDMELAADHAAFRLESDDAAYDVSSNLIGAHNVHNLAGVVLAALARGVDPAAIDRALRERIVVPGRLESWHRSDGAAFFVDYAHTDDALENVLSTLRPLTRNRLAVVFGAGGNRDRTKRPRMGRAASAADMLIVTTDNPRNEDPAAIIDEIVAGIPAGTKYEVVIDRREAIRRAFELAEPGDCVLVAGKGHEDYQEIAGVKHHFSDREILTELLAGCES